MPIYQLDGITPVIHPESFVHPSADIIGDVIISKNVYVGPQVAIRGDMGGIKIMDGSNIQDNCVIHGFPNRETVLEENSHIGHGAVIHGCHIEKNCLIGMNAVVMDLAVIGKESIVGAHSFIKAHSRFEARSMILGSPATVKRKVKDEELAWKERGTEMYHQLVSRCQNTMKEVIPLSYPEKNRPKMVFDKIHDIKS
ncbi:transferase hexapeptide repeat family protein [Photobacterium minamisatsumaniensis]|uniref:acyltransferase n=1 Tax=Photobacterium minamisatsumaniensis TaxID=2910233 RepID=UPI003D0B8280